MRVLLTATTASLCGELLLLLGDECPDWELATYNGAESAWEAALTAQWDVILWDLSLGNPPEIPSLPPATSLVVWGDIKHANQIAIALNNGASGHLVRVIGWHFLLPALLAAAAGKTNLTETFPTRTTSIEQNESEVLIEPEGRPVTRATESPEQSAGLQERSAPPMAVTTVTADGLIIEHNESFIQFTDLKLPNEDIDNFIFDFVDDPRQLKDAIKSTLQTHAIRFVELKFLGAEGRWVPSLVAVAVAESKKTREPVVSISIMGVIRGEANAQETALNINADILADALTLINQARSVDELLDRTLTALGDLYPDSKAMAAIDQDDNEIWQSKSHGIESSKIQAVSNALIKAGHEIISNRLLQVKQDDHELPLELRQLCKALNVTGCYWMPLTNGTEILGGIIIALRNQAHTVSEATTIETVGLQVSRCAALININQALVTAQSVQNTIIELSKKTGSGGGLDENLQQICDATLQLSVCCCCLQLLDDEQKQFVRSYYSSLEQYDQEDYHLRSWSGVWDTIKTGMITEDGLDTAIPLMLGEKILGVLAVRRRDTRAYYKQELQGLNMLAAQATTTINYAHLFEVAQRHSKHMEVVATQAWNEEARARALFDFAATVTEKTNLREILADVSRSACAEIGFERARIYLANLERQTLNGQFEASNNSDPVPIDDEVFPLSHDMGGRLAEAALGTGPYMIDISEEPSLSTHQPFERLFVPMAAQNVLVGLIVADNPTSGNEISAHQTRLLRSLAGLASVAIERARVERLRGTLISSVSHELRAPLASIRAYNELVMSGDAGEINEEQHLYLERVETSSRRLERLIADLMNLSKLRAGDVSIIKAATDMNTVVNNVLDLMSPKARDATISLIFDDPESIPPFLTDASRLEQVITNLVDNAIKFGEPDGFVKIKLNRSGSNVVLQVSDNGPGIPASHLHLIFEEFQHGTDARSRAKDGAGLGLAIAKRVVEVLRGEIAIESVPGEGTTFTVTLPFDLVATPPTEKMPLQPGLPMIMGETNDRTESSNH